MNNPIAPIGPAATFGRNFMAGASALVSLFFLSVVALGLLPMPNALAPLLGGIGFAFASLLTAFFWVPLVRELRRQATVEQAIASVAFMRVIFGDSAGNLTGMGSGWILVRERDIKMACRHTAFGMGSLDVVREIPLTEIERISIVEGNWMEYSMLKLDLRGGETLAFTLIPTSGSGLRGARIDEIRAVEGKMRNVVERNS